MSADPTFHLKIGEIIVCPTPAIVSTVLGSCISVTLYSPNAKVGGMIHFAHPTNLSRQHIDDDYRYGDVAIPALVQSIVELTKEPAQNLIAKIVGGAKQRKGVPSALDVGSENVRLAKTLLKKFKIKILGEDTGHEYGRRVIYHSATNRLQVAPVVGENNKLDLLSQCKKILAIGASTGGTEAISKVLLSLPANIPPTLIVQHIPPVYSKAFAERLNQLCPFRVSEANDLDEIKPGQVLIAPGGRQMKVQRSSKGYCVRVNDELPESIHKPSVDHLFHSVAEIFGKHAVGVILTGMGSDGADGLYCMHARGARTIAQDESSSTVYGMPKVASERGAVDQIVSLNNIPERIIQALVSKSWN